MVKGEYWAAYSDEPLKQGMKVKVVKIEGLRIKVTATTER